MNYKQFYSSNDNQHLQIDLPLFSKCNLNCAFCFQDHKSKQINIQFIKDIPKNIKKQLPYILQKNNYKHVSFLLWGGQVFADDLPDSIFDLYIDLINELKKVMNFFNLKTKFQFSSNFIFHNTQRILKFKQKTNVEIATSFDPLYRFKSKQQMELWKENIKKIPINCVNITITKPNIYQYINKPEYLEMLKNYNVYMDYYIYNKNYNFFKYDQDDLFLFLKYCIDNNYTNITEIKSFLQSDNKINKRHCNCNNTCIYVNGKLSFNCVKNVSQLPESQFFDKSISEQNIVEQKYNIAIGRNNCLICDYFKKCRNFCLASMLHKTYNNHNCALKRIYDYIKNRAV